jgi:RimJ/RimL family protein N-acetyltransferase
VKEWHSLQASDWQPQELPHIVADLLTDPVTRSLQPSWQGSYTVERARTWIRERDQEGTTLIVVNKPNGQAVGLMILFEMEAEGSCGTEVRLGYLMSEASWGQGFASELVDGFVGWCREHTSISSIAGGVALDNPASKRVLEKNGFELIQTAHEIDPEEELYRLSLRCNPV